MRSNLAIAALMTAACVLASCELNETPPPTGRVAPDPVRDQPIEDSRPPALDDVPRNGAGEAAFDASDEAITQQIRDAIAADEWLSSEARQIEVSTESGVVTLRGRVESGEERDIVMDIAQAVDDVRDVIDELEVRDDG